MMPTSPLNCAACGAANQTQATLCWACGQPSSILSGPLSYQDPAPSSAASKPSSSRNRGHRLRKVIMALLMLSGVLIFSYAGILAYVATRVEYSPPLPITKTPAAYGLRYRDVTFYSRIDHLRLRGWFIPGFLPDGRLTAQRTLIMVHGTGSNRAAPLLLELGSALARHGLAILAFDMRGNGESAPAPSQKATLSSAMSWGLSISCALTRSPIQNWDTPAKSQPGAIRWERQRFCWQPHMNQPSGPLSRTAASQSLCLFCRAIHTILARSFRVCCLRCISSTASIIMRYGQWTWWPA